jgi:hypothetical protein
MNSPRRRRANPPDQRCRCAECDTTAEGINLDPEACMQAVADDIHAVGWSVSAVLGDEIAPPWAYTIGLWLSHQGPELTMFGLPVEHMTIILNSIGERIANGAVIEAGDELDGILPVLAGDPAGPLELAVDHPVRRLRPVLRLRATGLPAGCLARPEGPLSGRSGLPAPVRGQAADAVAAP